MALSGAVGSYQEFGYTGGMQSVTIPVDGIYKLEAWGAQGGNGAWDTPGLGGYSCGYIKFKKNKTIYIVVGGQGGNRTAGYNGGGTGGIAKNGDYMNGGGGGGATHVAVTNRGVLKNYVNNRDEILIVAGGGGGNGGNRGGGSGGGLNGGTPWYPVAGTQTTGYAFGRGGNGSNGRDESEYMSAGGGGGGGWFGGHGATGKECGGAGGSGYINGVPSFSYNGTTYSPSTSNGQRYGNGYAKITFVALTKIYNLNVDGSAVQTAYLDGVALEQIKFDGVSVFGNP